MLYLNNYKRKEVITYDQKERQQKMSKTNTTKDYASQIAEKQEIIAYLNSEIASINANIENLKVALKEKKTFQ